MPGPIPLHSRPASPAAPGVTADYARYATPEALARDARLSPRVRLRLLADWAEDLADRLRASDENMAGDDPGATGDVLRRVHVCVEELGGPPARRH